MNQFWIKSVCWICYGLGVKDPFVPKPNGIEVTCDKCNGSFCGFNHLMSHICRKKPESEITIEDIFREILGNPDWGTQPLKLEVVAV